MLKSFVMYVNPSLGICLRMFTVMLSGPCALSLCILLSIFLVSRGLVGGMECEGGPARKSPDLLRGPPVETFVSVNVCSGSEI